MTRIKNLKFKIKNFKGFTLIELLITIMIIGILVTIATFGLRQAQSSARDGKRKADLENISIGLELYRSDCNSYPDSLNRLANGSDCKGEVYISTLPVDPLPPRVYTYTRVSPGSVVLCASLEQLPNPPVPTTNCGTCNGSGCNWRVSWP